jgi:hypothetical protein
MNYLEVPRLVPFAASSLNELKDESRPHQPLSFNSGIIAGGQVLFRHDWTDLDRR